METGHGGWCKTSNFLLRVEKGYSKKCGGGQFQPGRPFRSAPRTTDFVRMREAGILHRIRLSGSRWAVRTAVRQGPTKRSSSTTLKFAAAAPERPVLQVRLELREQRRNGANGSNRSEGSYGSDRHRDGGNVANLQWHLYLGLPAKTGFFQKRHVGSVEPG